MITRVEGGVTSWISHITTQLYRDGHFDLRMAVRRESRETIQLQKVNCNLHIAWSGALFRRFQLQTPEASSTNINTQLTTGYVIECTGTTFLYEFKLKCTVHGVGDPAKCNVSDTFNQTPLNQ